MTPLNKNQWIRVIVLAVFMALIGIVAYQCDRVKSLTDASKINVKKERIKVITDTIYIQTKEAKETLKNDVKEKEKHQYEAKAEQDAYNKYINREKAVDTVYENNAKGLENYN